MEEGISLPFRKVAVPDTFCETGSAAQLFDKYGISADHIIAAVKSTL